MKRSVNFRRRENHNYGFRVAGAAGVLFAVVLGGLTLSSTPAQAQCTPGYCSDASNGPPPPQTTCSMVTTTASPGQTLTVHVNNVTPGTVLTLLFDGTAVGSGTAAANGGSNGSADISFSVPANATPGKHTLFVSGAGVQCDPTGAAGLTVAAAGAAPSSGGSGSLARTGIEVAALLAVALVLLLSGAQLVRSARQRRRRHANRVRHLDHV